ncbi:MAG: TetR/AcrR family transcriptional regulator [Herbinix sp.]|jgi:AcrR family transcriptional regulator|nr:TetR/AcrR family transcriptional regulator [Herbinix sp.]
MRTTKKPDERRKEILDTAMKLFLSNGYENTSVEDITNDIQIAKGSFYNYFKSKQDVFEACILIVANKTVDQYLLILNNGDKPVVERLIEYIEYNFELSQQENNDLFEAIHSPTFDAIHTRVMAESKLKLIQAFTDLIKTGMEDSKFHTIDAEFTATALLGALSGVHDLLSKRRDDTSEEQRRLIYELMGQILGVNIH